MTVCVMINLNIKSAIVHLTDFYLYYFIKPGLRAGISPELVLVGSWVRSKDSNIILIDLEPQQQFVSHFIRSS